MLLGFSQQQINLYFIHISLVIHLFLDFKGEVPERQNIIFTGSFLILLQHSVLLGML